MPIVAFDSKPFTREKKIHPNVPSAAPSTPSVTSDTEEKSIVFHTQLGAGVCFTESDFVTAFIDKQQKLASSFGLQSTRPFFSARVLNQNLGISKAIAFVDQLITSLQKHIDFIHLSYVILPPSDIPEVSVGGYKCPATTVPTNKFLESLNPMYSYLTGYSFLHEQGTGSNWEFKIDSFKSKQTYAWDELIKLTKPSVYIRGDDCNPYICCADLVAFLTDAKLYTNWLRLEPSDIKKAWEGYDFDVTVRFLDKKSLRKYAWYNQELINARAYYAKPIVYLLIDRIEDHQDKLQPTAPTAPTTNTDTLGSEIPTSESSDYDLGVIKRKKFNQVIEGHDLYSAVTKYAFMKGGCAKVYESGVDMQWVADGDVLVYGGTKSKRIATTLSDVVDVEVISGKELRKKVKVVTVIH